MSTKRFIVEVDHEKTVWMDWNWNIHRENDLPAIEYQDGSNVWYKNGVKHRNGDLPAVSYPDGHEEYWEHGKLHRELGPAIIKSDGTCFYYHKGEEYFPDN